MVCQRFLEDAPGWTYLEDPSGSLKAEHAEFSLLLVELEVVQEETMVSSTVLMLMI